MQNRTMFPYRRPGQKKRPKNAIHQRGKPKGGPPKGVPGSARELLPMLQPATKALAQMLAGRTQQSGQFGHARAVLARAERVVAERSTDRLTPAEREEFFEQFARLKLTVADAEIEAEVSAEEAETPKPAAPPVAHERLKEMALALATGAPPAPPTEPAPPVAAAPPTEPAAPSPSPATSSTAAAPMAEPDALGDVEPAGPAPAGRRRRRAGRRPATAVEGTTAAAPDHVGNGQGRESEGAAPKPPQHAGGNKRLHLPDGWVLDEEGFVVPRTG